MLEHAVTASEYAPGSQSRRIDWVSPLGVLTFALVLFGADALLRQYLVSPPGLHSVVSIVIAFIWRYSVRSFFPWSTLSIHKSNPPLIQSVINGSSLGFLMFVFFVFCDSLDSTHQTRRASVLAGVAGSVLGTVIALMSYRFAPKPASTPRS